MTSPSPLMTPRILMTPITSEPAAILGKMEPIQGHKYRKEACTLQVSTSEDLICTPTNLSSRPITTLPVVPDLQDLQDDHDFLRPSLLAPRAKFALPRPTLRPRAFQRRTSATFEARVGSHSNGQEASKEVLVPLTGLPQMPDASLMGQGVRRCRALKPRFSR